jgi:hypothetical protein
MLLDGFEIVEDDASSKGLDSRKEFREIRNKVGDMRWFTCSCLSMMPDW